MTNKAIEFEAKQLTEEWFSRIKAIEDNPTNPTRERKMARLLHDCGTVINALILGLHRATIVVDEIPPELNDPSLFDDME